MDINYELRDMREKIDSLDNELLALFKERMLISEKIAAIKAAENLSIVDEKREQQVIDKAAATVAAEDDKWALRAFMSNVLILSKLKQHQRLRPGRKIIPPSATAVKGEKLTIAYQAGYNDWGGYISSSLFPGAVLLKCDSIEKAAAAVKSGAAAYGVLPVESLSEDIFAEHYEVLRKTGTFITAQCWTAADQPQHKSCLTIIAADMMYDDSCDRVSLCFSAPYKSGALNWALQVFMLADINVSNILIKPLGANANRYFVDIEAGLLTGKVREALQQAAAYAEDFNILGCYRCWPEKEKIGKHSP